MNACSCLICPYLFALVPFAVSLFPGAWLVTRVLRFNPAVRRNEESIRSHFALSDWIGVFERWIAIALILHGQFSAIAFLVAAKGLLRLPELRGASAEGGASSFLSSYVLLGTLVSITLAIAIAELWLAIRPLLCC